MKNSILNENLNYSKKEVATKASFLIDGANYFEALSLCLRGAKKTILINAWDIHSHIFLRGKQVNWQKSNLNLSALLHELVLARPELEIYILCWNYPVFRTAPHEPTLLGKAGWVSHERIHFRLDDYHPIGASHHQKIVVIDEHIAFAGGLDLSTHRWDTSEHKAADPRRVDAEGENYPPFHDVQIMVEGEAARALGEVFRVRWQRATGKVLSIAAPSTENNSHPWPDSVPVDISHVPVAVSVTYPDFGGYPEQKEIEHLSCAAIQKAENYIYIESQTLTSKKIALSLEESLRKAEGPEVVVVLPRKQISLLEEWTMGLLQNTCLKRLKESDSYKRLGIFYPHIPHLSQQNLAVHSKVLIVDDVFVKIGSSNMNNRSMGLDTECDVSMEAGDREDIHSAIRHFKNRLIAEHSGLSTNIVEEALKKTPSLLKFLLSRIHEPRALKPLVQNFSFFFRMLRPLVRVSDPMGPLRRERLMSEFLKKEPTLKAPRLNWSMLGLILIFGILALVWTALPVFEIRAELTKLPELFEIVMGFFLVGGLFLLPTELLVLCTLTLLGAKTGLPYAWIGVLFICLVQYLFGWLLGENWVRFLVSRRLRDFGHLLRHLRALPTFFFRFLPVAPLSILNLISGAQHMPLLHFMTLCFYGTLPFIFFLGLFVICIEFMATWSGNMGASLSLLVLAFTMCVLLVLSQQKSWKKEPTKIG